MAPKRNTNEKVVAARERDAAKKEEQKTKAQKEKEDKMWEDNDKNLAKKSAKKDAEAKKKEEALARKAEAKALLEKEMTNLKAGKAASEANKATRHHIESNRAKLELERLRNLEKERLAKKNVTVQEFTNENMNRQVGEMIKEGHVVATTLDEAIEQLTVKDPIDKNPERRMKALHAAYLDRRIPELKIEYPGLRLSQLKEIVWKEWQKSPENPFNQGQLE